MLANIIVGGIFILIIGLAFKKTYLDIKNNKCSCSGSCSKQKTCQIVKFN